MRGGPKVIAYMLIFSMLMGLLVAVLHPDYRDTARCILRGRSEQSPIWIGNERYYSEIVLDDAPEGDQEGGRNGAE